MLNVSKNKVIRFKFSFNDGISFHDPLMQAVPEDIYVSILRGQNSYGNLIEPAISAINSSYKISNITNTSVDGQGYIYPVVTFSVNHNLKAGDLIIAYGVGGRFNGEFLVDSIVDNTSVNLKGLRQSGVSLTSFDAELEIARVVKKTSSYIERISESEYNFVYTVPETLQAGVYTVSIKTTRSSIDYITEINFQVNEQKASSEIKVSGYSIENSIVTIYTSLSHNLAIGDYVSISGVSNIVDGNYYIANVTESDQFLFQLNVANKEYATVYPYGSVSFVSTEGVSPLLSGPSEPTKISYRPLFDSLQPYSTNSVLLIGHADGVLVNDVMRVTSIQEAINILGADKSSPLLRGVFEAYNAGARDIFICAAAPMSEYIEHTSNRLESKAFLSSSSTPNNLNFYQKYYERLADTYEVVKNFEFIDIIVPLETSIINTDNIDFITQLANYCNEFHNQSGFVQIGIIGSRSNGIKDSDVQILESNTLFKNKFTTYDSSNQISSDIGRFVIPIYGEVNFDHTGFTNAYAGTAAAAFAGTLSNTPVYNGMIRKRVKSAYSVYGANLSADSLSRLDNLGINTIYRSRKASRGNPYEIYISNDYTLAAKNSIFSKTPQVRLAAMVINEIKSIGYNSIGKFSYDRIINNVRSMLNRILAAKAIRDYSLDAYADKYEPGVLVFDIELISSLSLKNIKFSVSTGPGA